MQRVLYVLISPSQLILKVFPILRAVISCRMGCDAIPLITYKFKKQRRPPRDMGRDVCAGCVGANWQGGEYIGRAIEQRR